MLQTKMAIVISLSYWHWKINTLGEINTKNYKQVFGVRVSFFLSFCFYIYFFCFFFVTTLETMLHKFSFCVFCSFFNKNCDFTKEKHKQTHTNKKTEKKPRKHKMLNVGQYIEYEYMMEMYKKE